MSEIETTADRFALSLQGILDEYGMDVDEAMLQAADDAGQEGKKLAKDNARQWGWKDYPNHFGYKAGKEGQLSFAEVGSTKPGLVHLLEKGHAVMGGGRTRAFPHMAPAADQVFADFMDTILKRIGDIR